MMMKWISCQVKSHCLRHMVLAVAFSLVFTLGVSKVAFSEEPDAQVSKPRLEPVAMYIYGGADRIKNASEKVLSWMGYARHGEFHYQLLTHPVNNQVGIDHTRPYGVLGYFDNDKEFNGDLYSLNKVQFAPTKDQERLMYSNSINFLNLIRISQNHYRQEVVDPASKMGYATGISMFFQDAYVLRFDTRSQMPDLYEIPDITELVTPFSSKYDFSFVLNMNAISPVIREVFNSQLSQQVSTALQQRDGEIDVLFQNRKTTGVLLSEYLQMFLRDAEEACFGIDFNSTKEIIVAELTLKCKPSSPLLKNLNRELNRPSIFSTALSSHLPFHALVAMRLEKIEQELLVEHIEFTQEQLKIELQHPSAKSLLSSYLGIYEVIKANIETGEIESLVQVKPDDANFYVFVNAYKVNKGFETLKGHIHEVLGFYKLLDNDWGVDVNCHTHQGVTFSRISLDSAHADKDIWGGRPSYYIGTGRGMVWLGMGGSDTLNKLDECLDNISAASSGAKISPPLQFQMNADQLLNAYKLYFGPDPDDVISLNESLNNGLDSFDFELRFDGNGIKVKLAVEEEFVLLVTQTLKNVYPVFLAYFEKLDNPYSHLSEEDAKRLKEYLAKSPAEIKAELRDEAKNEMKKEFKAKLGVELDADLDPEINAEIEALVEEKIKAEIDPHLDQLFWNSLEGKEP